MSSLAGMFARLRKQSRYYHEHGLCSKRDHQAGSEIVQWPYSYFHDAKDDGQYVVDGVTYCGRCHCVMPAAAAGKGTP